MQADIILSSKYQGMKMNTDKKEIDKEALRTAIDFSDLENEIENVAQKYFKYWLQGSFKDEEAESKHIAPVTGKLVVDFKNAIVNSLIRVKSKIPNESNNELTIALTMPGAIAGFLDRIWNKEYLGPMGISPKEDIMRSEVLTNHFNMLNLTKFVKKNKDILPDIKIKKTSTADQLLKKILSGHE